MRCTRLALACLSLAIGASLLALRWVQRTLPSRGPLHVRSSWQGQKSDGSEAFPFRTLKGALLSAPPGSEVRIAEGTYRERLAVLRSVSLVGAGANRTRIVSPGEGGVVVSLLSANDVSLRGLSVEGGAVGVEVSGGTGLQFADVSIRGASTTGLLARSAGVRFSAGEVLEIGSGVAGVGIQMDGGSLELHGSVFRRAGRRALLIDRARCLIDDIDVEGSGLSAVQAVAGAEVEIRGGRFALQGGAALFASAAHLKVRGSRIEDNESGVVGYRGAVLDIESAQIVRHRIAAVALVSSSGSIRRSFLSQAGTDAAISVSESRDVLLEGNQITDPGYLGVHLVRSQASLEGNDISGARLDRQGDFGDAIFALEADLVLHGNVLHGNAGNGAALSLSKAQVSGNDFLDSGRAGLLLFDRAQATLRDNLFERNQGPGLAVVERSYAALRGNRFGRQPGFEALHRCGQQASGGTVDLKEGNSFEPEGPSPLPCR